MKKVFLTAAVVVLFLLASVSTGFAMHGDGPVYDTCPRDFMDAETLARFDEIIANFKVAMEPLRGVKEAFEERLELKIEKRDALRELVPVEFQDRFGNFNPEPRGNCHRGSKGSGQ